MKRDALDRWLSEDEAIVPSSGFTARVMDAVHREASASPAIPFPWTRALPGLVMTAVALAVAVWSGSLAFNDPSALALLNGRLQSLLLVVADTGTSADVTWLVFAAIVTVVPAMLSLRMMRRHS
jgi:hypothetical protein